MSTYDALAAAQRQILDDLDARLAAQAQTIGTLAAELDTARAERDQARADLAACQASHPAPVARTAFGACSPKGAKPADVVTKWGKGAGVRAFASGGIPASAWARPAGAGVCHISAKPPIDVPLDEAAVVAWVAELLPGDIVEVWHELDVKYRNGSLAEAQVRQGLDRKAELQTILRRRRPDLRTAVTLSVWAFMDKGTYGADGPGGAGFYAHAGADLLGVDFDGIKDVSRYPDFGGALANIGAFLATVGRGFDGFTVPEFIHPRIAADPTGGQRAAWLTEWAARFAGAGAVAVHLYDYDYRPGQVVAAGSPEHDAWMRVLG